MKFAFSLLLVFSSCNAFSQLQLDYSVGFESIHVTDSLRRYKPGVAKNHPLFYRPIDIDVWYPAQISGTQAALRFGDLVQLFEDRASSFQDETSYDSIAEELTIYLAASLGVDPTKLSDLLTSSFMHAKPAAGNFPLIIYMSSFNGMSFENIHLFERFAARGCVVACVNSVGGYPGNMTTDLKGIREQIGDALSAKEILSKSPYGNVHNCAVVGYSWGSIAACLGAAELNAKAIVSLDGSERHHYGIGDDAFFSDIRTELERHSRTIPRYLYMQKDSTEGLPDSAFAYHERVRESQWIKIKGASHEDFSGLKYEASRLNHTISAECFSIASDLTIGFIEESLKNTGNFHREKKRQSSEKLIDTSYQAPSATVPYLKLLGFIKEKGSEKFLPYVSIGLLHENYGTLSGADGEFALTIPLHPNDTLKISCIGYEDQLIAVKDLQRNTSLTIHMIEKTMAMTEVVVEATRLKTKILGHTSRSKFFGGKLSSNQLGTAIGVKINIRKPVVLDQFRFTVSYNQLDTAVFRLNILTFKDGVPHESLTQHNIYYGIGKKTGTFAIDLLPYQITAHDDVLMSLEWVEGPENNVRDFIVFSASPANNGTYLKYSSQGKWKRFKGMGVGFNVKVRLLDEVADAKQE